MSQSHYFGKYVTHDSFRRKRSLFKWTIWKSISDTPFSAVIDGFHCTFNWISCEFCVSSSSSSKYFYKVSLLDESLKVLCFDSGQSSYKYTPLKVESQCILLGKQHQHNLQDFSSDRLIILCDVYTVYKDSYTYQNKFSTLEYLRKLSEDFNNVKLSTLKDPEVALRVGSETTFVNKAVLCKKSPVFAKLFECEMKEAKENSVIIEDIKMPVLQKMKVFLYSGIVPAETDVNTLISLYYAADKYCIQDLKVALGDHLSTKLSVKNVCLVLDLSERHKDEELKQQVLEYMRVYFQTVIVTEEWLELVHRNAKLALEVLKLIP